MRLSDPSNAANLELYSSKTSPVKLHKAKKSLPKFGFFHACRAYDPTEHGFLPASGSRDAICTVFTIC